MLWIRRYSSDVSVIQHYESQEALEGNKHCLSQHQYRPTDFLRRFEELTDHRRDQKILLNRIFTEQVCECSMCVFCSFYFVC